MRNPGTFLEKSKKVPEKFKRLKKKERSVVRLNPTIFRLAIERYNLCTVRDLFQTRQKHNLRVDSGSRDRSESFLKICLEHV